MKHFPRLLAAAAGLVALTTAAAPGWGLYVVRSGDTLWGLAQSHHTTVAALQRANHIHGSLIYIGEVIDLPGSGAGGRAAQEAHRGHAATLPSTRSYLVRSGDTVSAIAARAHTSVATVARLNHLSGDMVIYVGQRLRLPAPATTVYISTASNNGYAAAIAASAARLANSAEPSHAQIRSLVVSEARRQGLDPALAEAIAEQESGFTQRIVSPTDAVGVMQLEPATATWLASYTGRPLNPYNLGDNIRGGVTLLKILRAHASLKDAVAGYYQGLGSVQERGMYADTVAYVASVLALQRRYR